MSVGITCICTYEMRFNIRPKPQKPTIMKHKSKKIKTNQLNFWQTLKSLGTSSRSKCGTKNIGLKIDNEMFFDKLKVAEQFNMFFYYRGLVSS